MSSDATLANTRFRVPEHVCLQALGDELVLLNVNTGYYFGLDKQGKVFFEALTAGRSVATVIEALQKQYSVAAEQLKADFLEFSCKLQQHGLVVDDAEA